MITAKKLIEELGRFPPDALCYAYEGEIRGIIIVSSDDDKRQLGEIPASEGDRDGPTVFIDPTPRL